MYMCQLTRDWKVPMKPAYARRYDHAAAVLPVGVFLTGWLLAAVAVILLPLLAIATVILRALARPHRVPQDRGPRATVIDGEYEVIRPGR